MSLSNLYHPQHTLYTGYPSFPVSPQQQPPSQQLQRSTREYHCTQSSSNLAYFANNQAPPLSHHALRYPPLAEQQVPSYPPLENQQAPPYSLLASQQVPPNPPLASQQAPSYPPATQQVLTLPDSTSSQQAPSYPARQEPLSEQRIDRATHTDYQLYPGKQQPLSEQVYRSMYTLPPLSCIENDLEAKSQATIPSWSLSAPSRVLDKVPAWSTGAQRGDKKLRESQHEPNHFSSVLLNQEEQDYGNLKHEMRSKNLQQEISYATNMKREEQLRWFPRFDQEIKQGLPKRELQRHDLSLLSLQQSGQPQLAIRGQQTSPQDDYCSTITPNQESRRKAKNSFACMQPVACKFCGKVLSRKSTLDNHIKVVHYQQKDYKCHLCDKKFTQKCSLETHVRIHMKLKPHECEHCNSKFTNKGDLRRHFKTVHLKIKPHKCNLCGLAFGLPGQLKKHMRYVHTYIKDITCPYCDNLFQMAEDLHNHISDSHPETIAN